ncbi:hypothetical protein V8E36_008842 [Tilletia maclaganii]
MGGNYATPLTQDELRSVPLWVDKYQPTFPGRFPACRGCKGEAPARGDFHTSSNCANPTIPCALCNKWGHTGVSCPTNNNNNNGHDNLPGSGGGGNDKDDNDAGDGPFGGNGRAGLSGPPPPAQPFQYVPAGPAPTTAFPEERTPTSAPVIPVGLPPFSFPTRNDGASNPFGGFRGGSHGSRGRGHGSGTPNRTRYQQCYITPQGVVSRSPPAGAPSTSVQSSPSRPRKQQKRPRSPRDDDNPNDRSGK